jgi:hypothetical protein
MPASNTVPGGFDPNFDDTTWVEGWASIPVALIPPGVHPSGYRVERRILHDAEIFGRPYRLSAPFDCRLLYDPDGRLWMSNTPQEHIMMVNNASQSWGHVLVGGLGLGLYPQYAANEAIGAATHLTVIEASAVVREIVEPTLAAALDIPLEVQTGRVEDFLSSPAAQRYDTIFLDTWDTLDAAYLPAINTLRDRALHCLSPGGRVLLWGYGWMVRLFEDACNQMLAVSPSERRTWLLAQGQRSPQAVGLLLPVIDHFEEHVFITRIELTEALAWCRQHIVHVSE